MDPHRTHFHPSLSNARVLRFCQCQLARYLRYFCFLLAFLSSLVFFIPSLTLRLSPLDSARLQGKAPPEDAVPCHLLRPMSSTSATMAPPKQLKTLLAVSVRLLRGGHPRQAHALTVAPTFLVWLCPGTSTHHTPRVAFLTAECDGLGKCPNVVQPRWGLLTEGDSMSGYFRQGAEISSAVPCRIMPLHSM